MVHIGAFSTLIFTLVAGKAALKHAREKVIIIYINVTIYLLSA
jgi:hypothetical protein